MEELKKTWPEFTEVMKEATGLHTSDANIERRPSYQPLPAYQPPKKKTLGRKTSLAPVQVKPKSLSPTQKHSAARMSSFKNLHEKSANAEAAADERKEHLDSMSPKQRQAAHENAVRVGAQLQVLTVRAKQRREKAKDGHPTDL